MAVTTGSSAPSARPAGWANGAVFPYLWPLDLDGDGWFDDDCDDCDADVWPGAPEIADDGIDQDCDGSDLTTGSGDDTADSGVPGDSGDSEDLGSAGDDSGPDSQTDSSAGDDSAAGDSDPFGTPDADCATSPDDKAGCGCATGGQGGGIMALALAALLLRRRDASRADG